MAFMDLLKNLLGGGGAPTGDDAGAPAPMDQPVTPSEPVEPTPMDQSTAPSEPVETAPEAPAETAPETPSEPTGM